MGGMTLLHAVIWMAVVFTRHTARICPRIFA
jgi:hypothetical protein